MKVSAKEQMELVDEYSKQSALSLFSVLGTHADKLTRLTKKRAESLGLDEYGDKSFHLSEEQLLHEILEELADAIFYNCIRLSRIKVRG